MDILRASILELPTPTQFIPPPREYLQSDESYFGKGCKIVSALDAGVRAATEAVVPTSRTKSLAWRIG
jgi:hypothetical protein